MDFKEYKQSVFKATDAVWTQDAFTQNSKYLYFDFCKTVLLLENTQRGGFWCDQFDNYFIWELLAKVATGFRRRRGNPKGRTKGELGSKA